MYLCALKPDACASFLISQVLLQCDLSIEDGNPRTLRRGWFYPSFINLGDNYYPLLSFSAYRDIFQPLLSQLMPVLNTGVQILVIAIQEPMEPALGGWRVGVLFICNPLPQKFLLWTQKSHTGILSFWDETEESRDSNKKIQEYMNPQIFKGELYFSVTPDFLLQYHSSSLGIRS